MPGALEQAGAAREPSNFAPLHTDRIFTGFWPNRSVLRDGATTEYQLRYGLGRQDSMWTGSYNCEVSPFLTLIRRPGLTTYNPQSFPKIKSFYSFHAFTLTSEYVRVIVDTASAVYDATGNTQTVIFTKSPAAEGNRAYFLGVGNTLYITDGVENKQLIYDPANNTWTTFDWGIDAPPTAPDVTQSAKPNPYSTWFQSTIYLIRIGFVLAAAGPQALANPYVITVIDPNGNLQVMNPVAGFKGTTGGPGQPVWNATVGQPTPDGTCVWVNQGPAMYQPSTAYSVHDIKAVSVNTSSGQQLMMFLCQAAGTSSPASNPPRWNSGINSFTQDGSILWQNIGNALEWVRDLGPNTPVTTDEIIVDAKGYQQTAIQAGKTLPSPGPNFSTSTGAYTVDNSVVWRNGGAFSVATALPVQYGYAFENDTTKDVSGMSPPSYQVNVIQGNQVTIQGKGSGEAGVSNVYIYRTGQGQATFALRAIIPNPGAGQTWTYVDSDLTDAALNFQIQAQVLGEGTPLPAGAGPMAYHLGRIFVGVGNVVWVSSGPDAAPSASSGNAGFDQYFTLQSKITRFWVTSLGLIVFTARDSYIFLGSAQDIDPLYVKVYIPQLPLLSYDCFTEYMTSAYLYLGTRMVVKLDPGAGVLEVSFPVANYLLYDVSNYDPKSSYLTFHTQGSNETALYLSNGISEWMRMALSTVPETGSAWNPPAILSDGTSAVQSVEVDSGVFRLLLGPLTSGAIRQRDRQSATDNGRLFSVRSRFGSIALADPGQLAGLAWMTLTSTINGKRPELSALIGEIDGKFERVKRSHQDPPDLPVADSIRSDRHSFLQNQEPVWCRHFQFIIDWPAEDAFNELLTFTIVGQVIQEMKGA